MSVDTEFRSPLMDASCGTGAYDRDMWTIPGPGLTPENRYAIWVCDNKCPVSDWCNTQPPIKGMIRAGIPYRVGSRTKTRPRKPRFEPPEEIRRLHNRFVDLTNYRKPIPAHVRAGEREYQRLYTAHRKATS